MKILSFGEVMLRLTVPEHMLLEQSDTVRMSTVGTGVNLLGSLSHLGYQTKILTQVPDNSLGKKVAADLRKLGISDECVEYSGNHLGSFFVELGYGSRPERVIYQDRLTSSFCQAEPDEYDFEAMLEDVDYVHICGITLSLTNKTRTAALKLAEMAQRMRKTVCFDFNYRIGLNEDTSHSVMKERYEEILPYVDVAFGSIRDLTDLLDYPDIGAQHIFKHFMDDFDIEYFAGSNLGQKDSKKCFEGFIYHEGELYRSKSREVNILDRIGGRDAFASGIITGLIEHWDYDSMLQFAVANAVMTQEAMNDVPIFDKNDIFDYIQCDGKNDLIGY